LPFLAADGIAEFGIALAKHCNLVFCSLFYESTDEKSFLTDYATTCGVNGLASCKC